MLNEIISGPIIWLIAISLNLFLFVITNMTQKKEVININYDYYINNLYKVKGILLEDIRVLFSMLSITALLFVVLPYHPMRAGYFYVLAISTVFHITYFMTYGLSVNEAVKQDIYKFVFDGLYTPLEGDKRNAIRTDKEVSDKIIQYFNTYNTQTKEAFKEIFGPESFIYGKRENACDYISNKGSYHISYEFMELFQKTDLQCEWLTELLNLLNENDRDTTIENLIMTFACVRVFGKQDKLFSVAFIDAIKPYLNKVNEDSKASTPKSHHERLLLKEFYKYIASTLVKDNSIRFYKESERVYKRLLGSMCPVICKKYVTELLSDIESPTNERVKSFVMSLCSNEEITNQTYESKNELKENQGAC